MAPSVETSTSQTNDSSTAAIAVPPTQVVLSSSSSPTTTDTVTNNNNNSPFEKSSPSAAAQDDASSTIASTIIKAGSSSLATTSMGKDLSNKTSSEGDDEDGTSTRAGLNEIEIAVEDETCGGCFCGGCLRQLLRFSGPGFLVAMAYIDPGNLAADIDQGVAAGYTLAWVTLWCSILGFFIQLLSVKLGVATRSHLAEHCRERYKPFPRYTLWIVIELGILAVDILETISGAVAFNTLSNGAIPLWAGVLLTVVIGFGTLCLERWGMRLLEAAVVSMILVMAGTFGYMFFSTDVDYAALMKGLAVPQLNGEVLPYAVGAIGAIIMPHNLYLHSALALIRTDMTHSTEVKKVMKWAAAETGLSLVVALFINICIIAVFAAAFAGVGVGEVGLANAGYELAAKYGAELQYIWGAGLLAAAAASTVTSTYAGQVVIVGFLDFKVSVWWRAAVVRLATLGPTLAVAFIVQSDSGIAALAVWLNITQSIVLPLAITPLLVFTSLRAVMGKYVNKPWQTVFATCVVLFLIGMNGYLAVTFALDRLPYEWYALLPFGIVVAAYVAFLVYLALAPLGLLESEKLRSGLKSAFGKVKRVTMSRKFDIMEGF